MYFTSCNYFSNNLTMGFCLIFILHQDDSGVYKYNVMYFLDHLNMGFRLISIFHQDDSEFICIRLSYFFNQVTLGFASYLFSIKIIQLSYIISSNCGISPHVYS